jgi:peroxiredoxin
VDAEVVGISANVTFSQKQFADFIKLNYPLLSDYPDLKTIQAYGVLNPERRLAQRSWFIVDKKGVIRYKKVLAPKEPLVPNEVLIEELKKINQKS